MHGYKLPSQLMNRQTEVMAGKLSSGFPPQLGSSSSLSITGQMAGFPGEQSSSQATLEEV